MNLSERLLLLTGGAGVSEGCRHRQTARADSPGRVEVPAEQLQGLSAIRSAEIRMGLIRLQQDSVD